MRQYTESNKREGQINYFAQQTGKYKVCFRKLDLKTKKVTFHATIVSHNSEDTASLQTVDLIVKDLEKLQ